MLCTVLVYIICGSEDASLFLGVQVHFAFWVSECEYAVLVEIHWVEC